jgi:CDP-ribitol ribitolphosphotransferase
MSKPVLFVTGLGKQKDRAENMQALFNAYQGEKLFMSTHSFGYAEAINSKMYQVVYDIFPTPCNGKCIMIWHAIQGGKLIGLDEEGTYYRKDYADLMQFIIVAGRGGIDMFHQCTGVPKERILPLGMPRTDRYIGKKKGDGGTELAQKRAYLFAPTFRNGREPPMPYINWNWLDEHLTDDEILLVKPHPQGKQYGFQNCKHIMEVPKMYPSVNYLYDCDVVITDYSSIIFDGWLLNKPAVLFEKDKGYTKTRGMYLKYPDEYCSRYATNEQELLDLVRSAKGLTRVERKCRDYVADACDGHSCERISALLNEMR